MLYTGTEQEQYEVILSLIADGTGFIQRLLKICCDDDGVPYPYQDDDFCVSMLKCSNGANLFQIDLPEYNKDINDIVRVYIVFNVRDGEILFKKYFLVKWFVKDQQERVIYIDPKEGGYIGTDLTEHMGDVAYERNSVMKDCARVLIRDINRMERPSEKIE